VHGVQKVCCFGRGTGTATVVFCDDVQVCKRLGGKGGVEEGQHVERSGFVLPENVVHS